MSFFRNFLFILIVGPLWMFVAGPAQAQVNVGQLLAQGQYQAAYAATQTEIAAGETSPELLLMHGFSLFGLGRVQETEAVLDHVERQEKTFLYYILRGHVHSHKRQFNHANMAYRRAHDFANTDAEAQTAANFSRAMQAARKWVWSANLTMRQSDNLNFMTTKDTADVGGLPFRIPESNQAQSGHTLAAQVSGKYKFVNSARHLVQGGLMAEIDYARDTGINSKTLGVVIDGKSIFSMNSPRQVVLSYGITASQSLPADGIRSVNRTAYLQASGSFRPMLGWTAGISAADKITKDPLNSQSNLAAHVGINGTLPDGMGVGITLSQGEISSQNANVAASFRKIGFSAQPAFDDLPFGVAVFAEYAKHDYTRETPFFGGMREDRTATFGLTVTAKEWTFFGMEPSITASKSMRRSNIDINDATSQDIYVGLRSSF